MVHQCCFTNLYDMMSIKGNVLFYFCTKDIYCVQMLFCLLEYRFNLKATLQFARSMIIHIWSNSVMHQSVIIWTLLLQELKYTPKCHTLNCDSSRSMIVSAFLVNLKEYTIDTSCEDARNILNSWQKIYRILQQKDISNQESTIRLKTILH